MTPATIQATKLMNAGMMNAMTSRSLPVKTACTNPADAKIPAGHKMTATLAVGWAFARAGWLPG
jgi:hypothetical protein